MIIKSNIFKSQIVTQSKFLFIANSLDKVFYFLFFVVLARILNIENYGLVIAFTAVLQIFFQFVELGFHTYIQRSISREELKDEEVACIINSRILVSSFVFLLPLIYFHESSRDFILFIYAFTLTHYLIFISGLVSSFYFGKNNSKKYLLFFIKSVIPKYFLLIFLFLNFLSLIVYQTVLVVLHLLILINELVLIKNTEDVSYSFYIKWRTLKKILRTSLILSIGLIAVSIYDRLDVVILREFLGSEPVAIYGVAYSIYKIPLMFSGTVLVPIFTRFSKEYRDDGKLDVRKVNQIVKYFLLFSIVYYIVIFFIGDSLIQLLWGKEFLDSYNVLILLNFSIPFVLLNNLTGVILNSTNKEKLATGAAIISTVFGLFLYPITIILLGLKGAIISTILIEAIVFLVQFKCIINKKIIKLNEIIFFKSLYKT